MPGTQGSLGGSANAALLASRTSASRTASHTNQVSAIDKKQEQRRTRKGERERVCGRETERERERENECDSTCARVRGSVI